MKVVIFSTLFLFVFLYFQDIILSFEALSWYKLAHQIKERETNSQGKAGEWHSFIFSDNICLQCLNITHWLWRVCVKSIVCYCNGNRGPEIKLWNIILTTTLWTQISQIVSRLLTMPIYCCQIPSRTEIYHKYSFLGL